MAPDERRHRDQHERVFETFVSGALREATRPDPLVSARHARRGVWLDEPNRAASTRPVLVGRCTLRVRGRCEVQANSAAGIKHPDIYQLLAYTTAATGLPGGLLIYAKGEHPQKRYAVRHAGKQLHVITLALDGPADEVLREIVEVAKLVRTLRRDAAAGTTAAAA